MKKKIKIKFGTSGWEVIENGKLKYICSTKKRAEQFAYKKWWQFWIYEEML